MVNLNKSVIFKFLVSIIFMASVTGCLNNSDETATAQSSFGLNLRPDIEVLMVNESTQFYAEGGKSPYVYEQISGTGVINSVSGAYTAPSTAQTVTIRVTDSENLTVDFPIVVLDQLQIAPVGQVIVETTSLTFSATGGGAPYRYSLVIGEGTIDPLTGVYVAADQPGSAIIQVTDNYGYTSSTTLSIIPRISVSPNGGAISTQSKVLLSSSGGQPPYTYSIVSGDAYIDPVNGVLTAGYSEGDIVVQVTDSLGFNVQVTFTASYGIELGLGADYTCGVNLNRQAKCWGNSRWGGHEAYFWGEIPTQMGAGLLPVRLHPGRYITHFSGFGIHAQPGQAIVHHACAILDDNSFKCWGGNNDGKLGTGNTNRYSAQSFEDGSQIPTLNLGVGLVPQKIVVGDSHTCALTTVGSVKCWGSGSGGANASNTTTNSARGDNEALSSFGVVSLGTGITAVDLVAGAFHNCIITTTGDVRCWGSQASGQLGTDDIFNRGDTPGSTGDQLVTVDLQGGRTALELAAGRDHTCARLSDNNVKCWGDNTYGQLGINSSPPPRIGRPPNSLASGADVSLGSGRTAKRIFAGGFTTCAILDNDTLKCWGRNTNGQLGLGVATTVNRGDATGEMGDSLPTVSLGTGAVPLELAIRDSQTCAVIRDTTDSNKKKVKCWGRNDLGQAGQGYVGLLLTLNLGDDAGEMGNALAYVDLAGVEVNGVYVHGGFSCAMLTTNELKCWGQQHDLNGYRGVDLGDAPGEVSYAFPSVNFGTTSRIRQISAKSTHNCAVFENGRIKCWGGNTNGQLGLNDTNNRGDSISEMGTNLPFVDLGGQLAKAVSAGFSHTCAHMADDTVRCWGSNGSGQLGRGSNVTIGDSAGEMPAQSLTVNLGTGELINKVEAGNSFTCALLKSGQVKCWGLNSSGQLGLNTGNAGAIGDIPAEMGDNLVAVSLGTGLTATDIAVGSSHACAVLSNYSVKCWGANNLGQLGLGNTSTRGASANQMGDSLPAVDLGVGQKALRVFANQNNSCAILQSGDLKCWGDEGNGNRGVLGQGVSAPLGDAFGEMGDNLPAIQLGAGRRVVNVAIGSSHMCAVLDNSLVKCWGANGNGQLGLNDFSNRGNSLSHMGEALRPVRF